VCLRLQQPPAPQRTLQRRLHLHVAELGDSEVEVLDGGVVFVGVVVEEEFGEAEANQRDFGPEAHPGTRCIDPPEPRLSREPTR
jgi:hypothetical protein